MADADTARFDVDVFQADGITGPKGDAADAALFHGFRPPAVDKTEAAAGAAGVARATSTAAAAAAAISIKTLEVAKEPIVSA